MVNPRDIAGERKKKRDKHYYHNNHNDNTFISTITCKTKNMTTTTTDDNHNSNLASAMQSEWATKLKLLTDTTGDPYRVRPVRTLSTLSKVRLKLQSQPDLILFEDGRRVFTCVYACLLVFWALNIPATCTCLSGTDLLNSTCCHTETEVADQTFYLTRSLTPGKPATALTL